LVGGKRTRRTCGGHDDPARRQLADELQCFSSPGRGVYASAKWARDFLVGQAKNSINDIEFTDYSVHEPFDVGMAKRALVVGLDGYETAPLTGCVNDARLIGGLLERPGLYEYVAGP
jgi:hypothetical protein